MKNLSRIFFMLAVFLLLVNFVSAVRINEVEMNPSGKDSGNEWIELYNDENQDIDISNWEIWEGIYGSQGPKLILTISENTTIAEKEFYIVEWGGSKLNNKGDFVIIYDSLKNEIDRTETLNDNKDNELTQQLCDGSWEFLEATKDSENACVNESPQNVEDKKILSNASDESDTKDTSPVITSQTVSETPSIGNTTLPTINLIPKDIKSDNNLKLEKNDYALYGFIAFCILLAFLFIIRKRKYNKNEFN